MQRDWLKSSIFLKPPYFIKLYAFIFVINLKNFGDLHFAGMLCKFLIWTIRKWPNFCNVDVADSIYVLKKCKCVTSLTPTGGTSSALDTIRNTVDYILTDVKVWIITLLTACKTEAAHASRLGTVLFFIIYLDSLAVTCFLCCAQRLYVPGCFAGFCSCGVPDHISVSFCDVF